MSEHEVYRRLADHLDRLPGGFAPTENGAELRLLANLFTPEEAELAMCLTLDREGALDIAARVGRPSAEIEARLAEMAQKGLIFAVYQADGPTLYQAAPWVVGICEFQVSNLSPAYFRASADYWSAPKVARRVQPAGGFRTDHCGGEIRTIPIGKNIDARLPVLPASADGTPGCAARAATRLRRAA